MAGRFLMAKSYGIFLHPPGLLVSRSHALAAQPVIFGDLWGRERCFSGPKISHKLTLPFFFSTKTVTKSHTHNGARAMRALFFPQTSTEKHRAHVGRPCEVFFSTPKTLHYLAKPCMELWPGFFSEKRTTKPNEPQQTSTSSQVTPNEGTNHVAPRPDASADPIGSGRPLLLGHAGGHDHGQPKGFLCQDRGGSTRRRSGDRAGHLLVPRVFLPLGVADESDRHSGAGPG